MAITAIDLVESFPGFIHEVPGASDLWDRVHNQAINHTRRTSKSNIFATARPNESDIVRKYRESNVRHITSEGVRVFVTTVQQALDEIIVDNLSESLSTFLHSNPYYVNGQRVDWKTYFYDYILQLSLDSCNSVQVDLPIIPETPQLAPFSNTLANRQLGVRTMIIHHGRIVATPDEVFAWKEGIKMVKNAKDEDVARDWFYIVDSSWFYTYEPISIDDKGNTLYELLPWYEHDTGFGEENVLPVNRLPGILSVDEGGSIYNESFLKPFFNFADEFDQRFSDGQAVWVRFGHPKQVIEPMECPAKNCEEGKVRVVGKDGEVLDLKECSVCNGSGILKDVSPYSTLVKKADRDGTTSTGPGIQLVTSDVAILDHAFKTPFELLEMGYRAIGIHMVASAAESGEAKKVRLRTQRDIKKSMAQSIAAFLYRHLCNVESILNVTRGNRMEPRVSVPLMVGTNDLDLLQMEAKEAIASDKVTSILRYLQKKYEQEPLQYKIQQAAYFWADLLPYLDDNEAIETRLLQGYGGRDLVRAEKAVKIFSLIASENEESFLSDSLISLSQKAEEMLIEMVGPEEEELELV